MRSQLEMPSPSRYRGVWVSSRGNVETEWGSWSLQVRRGARSEMEIWGRDLNCVEGGPGMEGSGAGRSLARAQLGRTRGLQRWVQAGCYQ